MIGNSELGIMKSLWERHMGHVLLVALSSSLEGRGAIVEDRQLRIHSTQVREEGQSFGKPYQDRKRDHS